MSWKDTIRKGRYLPHQFREMVHFIGNFAYENKLEDFDTFDDEIYNGDTKGGQAAWEDLDIPQRVDEYNVDNEVAMLLFSDNLGLYKLLDSTNPDYDMKDKFQSAIKKKFGGYFERHNSSVVVYIR